SRARQRLPRGGGEPVPIPAWPLRPAADRLDDKLMPLEYVVLGSGSRSSKVRTTPEIFNRVANARTQPELRRPGTRRRGGSADAVLPHLAEQGAVADLEPARRLRPPPAADEKRSFDRLPLSLVAG